MPCPDRALRRGRSSGVERHVEPAAGTFPGDAPLLRPQTLTALLDGVQQAGSAFKVTGVAIWPRSISVTSLATRYKPSGSAAVVQCAYR